MSNQRKGRWGIKEKKDEFGKRGEIKEQRMPQRRGREIKEEILKKIKE